MLKRTYFHFGMPIFAAGGIWLLGITSVLADEVPNIGLLYNTKEAHSMVYRCQQNRGNTLDCEFTQTAVRKKAEPEELNSKLKQAREEFRAGVKYSADECKTFGQVLDVLEGRKRPPKEEGFRQLTEMEKKDAVESGRAFLAFCRLKTEESYLNIVRRGHAKDVRTCLVSSHSFKQSFQFVQDSISGTGSWVTRGGPVDACGIVELSRFEPERLKDFEFVFWKYIARKAVTNPQGFFAPGVSCKKLDEGEYVYDWRSKEHSLGCDYIEFSP